MSKTRSWAEEKVLRAANRARWAAEDARTAALNRLALAAILSLTDETCLGVPWAFKLGAEMGNESDDIPELAQELWDTVSSFPEADAPKSWAIMREAQKLG